MPTEGWGKSYHLHVYTALFSFLAPPEHPENPGHTWAYVSYLFSNLFVIRNTLLQVSCSAAFSFQLRTILAALAVPLTEKEYDAAAPVITIINAPALLIT